MRNNQRMIFAGAGGHAIPPAPVVPEFIRFTATTFKDQLTRYTRTNDLAEATGNPAVLEDTVWAKATDMAELYSPFMQLGKVSVITEGTSGPRISGQSTVDADATAHHLPAQPQFAMDASKGHKGFKVILKSMTDYALRDPVGAPGKIIGSYTLLRVGEPGGQTHLQVRVIDFGKQHTFYILTHNAAGGQHRSESISVNGLYDANKPVTYVFNYLGTKAVLDIHHPETNNREERLEFRGLHPYDDKGKSVMQLLARNEEYLVPDIRTVELYSLEIHRTPDAL